MTLTVRANTRIPLALAAALILLPTVAAQGFSGEVEASTSLVDQDFDPFAGLVVAGAYARYSGVIDFIIYALLFAGIAHVTVGRRFEGRGDRPGDLAQRVKPLDSSCVTETLVARLVPAGDDAAGGAAWCRKGRRRGCRA